MRNPRIASGTVVRVVTATLALGLVVLVGASVGTETAAPTESPVSVGEALQSAQVTTAATVAVAVTAEPRRSIYGSGGTVTLTLQRTDLNDGEPDIIPTPENYAPLLPISTYGASKLACEALISSYCYTYGINGILFRLANIVGSRSNHGIIPDFIKKLQSNPNNLEILGDGTQSKSYLEVSDCVDSFFFCLEKVTKKVEVFNIGNHDKINVFDIAKIVCKNMNLDDVKFSPNGGVDNGRGWIGDVKIMHLDISKLKKLGWEPKLSSKSAIDFTSKNIQQHIMVKTIGN